MTDATDRRDKRGQEHAVDWSDDDENRGSFWAGYMAGCTDEAAHARRELENLPATRTCKCGTVFKVTLKHPRRIVCGPCVLAFIEKICEDCGGDDDAHRDTCPRSPTVIAISTALDHIQALRAVMPAAALLYPDAYAADKAAGTFYNTHRPPKGKQNA